MQGMGREPEDSVSKETRKEEKGRGGARIEGRGQNMNS